MQNARYALLFLFLNLLTLTFAQQSALSIAVKQFNAEAKRIQPWNDKNTLSVNKSSQPFESCVNQLLAKYSDKSFLNGISDRSQLSDSMLIIGAVPGDSLVITGDWICKVDILVFGDGKLRFKNANATILGNIYVWGASAEITADSSTLYIPQLYFYQRAIVAAGAGKVKFSHVTLDFSGLSHTMVAADSSTFEFTDVTKVGFTTNGVYNKARYFINGTNLAGEFVIGDKCQLDFRNANTVLLWHEVPKNGTFHFTFPPAGNVALYNFTPGLPGIANINYHIKLTDCSDVMWALMPADGSDVEISNSEIRAIGLWFQEPDSVNVSGLVNNSSYTDFTASLSDRNLRITNCSVKTWSLYPMRKSKVSVNGCILGEIGCQGTSQVTTNSVFIDGSGGYFSATDTAFLVAFSTPLTTTARSERNGILIYAYSPLSFGTAVALGNSTLLAIQSSLPEEPVAYDNASVWDVNIVQPSSGNSNSVIPITGFALIDRTATSTNPDLAWYQMFYSVAGNDSLIAITPKITTEKRNDTLANWNTAGLKPGQYLLHIFVSDDSEHPVVVEAVRSFSINPGVFGIENNDASSIIIYPNPVTEVLYLQVPCENCSASILSSTGSVIWKGNITQNKSEINVSAFAPGLYVLKIYHGDGIAVSRFIKQ